MFPFFPFYAIIELDFFRKCLSLSDTFLCTLFYLFREVGLVVS
nr:MAG TPA: hypothetical protein [Caudoviricetes sp.]